MTVKANRSAARRLAAEARARAEETPTLDPTLAALLADYRPDPSLVRGLWPAVVDAHREVLRRSRITGPESFKRHCWIVAGYLAWRAEQRLSVEIPDAMTFVAIDDYYQRGMTSSSEPTRNDYRSKLRRLAPKVNPSIAAPPAATPLGHQQVRPPYTPEELARIRRVARRQRNHRTRQQLCMGVALHGGAGLTPAEVRPLRTEQIRAGGPDAPIWVAVTGAKAREVPLRREFEELMRIGLEGVRPGQLVLGTVEGRRNILSGIVAGAENNDAPHIEARRLRSTWIATLMCERVPVKVIMDAAGLTSARTLTELAGMLPMSVDLAEVRGVEQ
jgi:integrase